MNSRVFFPSPPSTPPPTTPPPKKNNISINDLEDNYLIFLQEKIPILRNEQLLKLILEYCVIKLNEYKIQKINEINNILNEIYKIVNNYETIKINNKNLHILKKNNKIIKLHKITADGLIEAIINVTLYYYYDLNELNKLNESLKYTVNSTLKITKINTNIITDELNNKRFMQTMNIAEGVTLGNFIKNVYNQNISLYDKNEYILNILKKICKKLDFLQNKYLFIHGDFHSGNIIIDENENIKFIDFGFSSIRIPCKTKEIILSTPVDCNINIDIILNLNEIPYLKTIDMYHLIENLKDFGTSVNVQFNNKNMFNNFLEKLRKIYYKKPPKGNLHAFERRSNFIEYVDYEKLFCNNFDLITVEYLNNILSQKNTKKRMSNNSGSPKIKSIKFSNEKNEKNEKNENNGNNEKNENNGKNEKNENNGNNKKIFKRLNF